MQSIEWFRSDELAPFLPLSGMVIGGRHLLEEFVKSVALLRHSGHLALAVPFIGDSAGWLRAVWTDLPHESITVRIVTQPEYSGIAKDVFGQFPWESVTLIERDTLHAKVYAFQADSGSGACLIGSHNLTAAARKRNNEFGVMFRGMSQGPELAVVQACLAYVTML